MLPKNTLLGVLFHSIAVYGAFTSLVSTKPFRTLPVREHVILPRQQGHPMPFKSKICWRLYSTTAVNGSETNVAANNDDDKNKGSQDIVTAASTSASSSASTGAAANNLRLNVHEKARTVTSVCTSGTLCTVSAHSGIEGAPFGSFVDYVLDDQGNPILLMNEMSMHTINIETVARQTGQPAMVTLFTQLGRSVSGDDDGKELQDVSRCSLTGTLVKLSKNEPDMDTIRMRYSLTHTYADQVMDSPKFAFYRLIPQTIYFVGGFGVLAKWIDPADYRNAAPDILAREAASMIERINRDHVDDLCFTAQYLLGVPAEIERVRMTNVDRLGMDLRVTFEKGTRRNKLQTDEFRLGFRIPVQSVEDAKSEILKVFQEAWEKGNGVAWEDDLEAPGAGVPIMQIAADSLE